MKSKFLAVGAALLALCMFAASCGGDSGSDLDELNVAYFLEWPLPNQFEQNTGAFDDELGLTVNWVPFNTGVEMSAAMASGDIDIAYSQGLVCRMPKTTTVLPVPISV